MGSVVPDELERLGSLAGQDLDPRAVRHRCGQVAQGPVDLHRIGALGERFGDRAGDLGAGRAVGELATGAIGKAEVDHRTELVGRRSGAATS
jgi:hypothetical protein